MDISEFKPRNDNYTYRLGDSDDLVLMDNVGLAPFESLYTERHGIIIVCMEGTVQLEYDGVAFKIQKGDMFLYMVYSVAIKFVFSPDFNCRMVWFTRSRLWDMNRFANTMMPDLPNLKSNPVLHMSMAQFELFNTYFQLLSDRMRDNEVELYNDITHSLWGTLLLEILSMYRHQAKVYEVFSDENDGGGGNSSVHKKHLVDKFIALVEQSDGRIRRVDYFANQLNITPKYLSTILKEQLNRRPSIFIQHFTMKAIEQRLRYTDMTIQQISNDLRFPNPSFFGKYFKEHTGMTPMEYRTQYFKGREMRSEYEKDE